jgi:hypothetical protein
MNPRLIACAFLIGSTATLALGQDKDENRVNRYYVIRPGYYYQPAPGSDIRAQHVDNPVLHMLQHVDDPLQKADGESAVAVELQRQADERSYKEWLSKQSQDLLDIIKILYKGREADVQHLEDAQAKMESQDQIARRIRLIKGHLGIAFDVATVDATVKEFSLEAELSNQAWLSQELLDIIGILYKGRDAEVKQLEDAQAKMELQDQIESRIALIKSTLSSNTTK